MLPLLAVAVWVVAIAVRPRFDDSAAVLGDTLASSEESGGSASVEELIPARELFTFDPNEVTYEELRLLGVSKKTAAGIIRYRKSGKIFRIAEDFAMCYGVTDSMYAALKPYVIIGAQYAAKSRSDFVAGEVHRHKKTMPDAMSVSLSSFDPNTLTAEGFVNLGFSPKQAQVIVNYRNKIGGFGDAESFAQCYVVSDEMFSRLKDYIVFRGDIGVAKTELRSGVAAALKTTSRIEINSADSATLVSVRGIGPNTAAAVVAYRKRLGGFNDAAQICETGVVTERNWEIMREQIWADSCAIQKIDINFATPNTIARHPYIGNKTLRKLLRNRQLKGGWSTIEDMLKDNTLTAEEARKLAPYLQFRAATR